MSLANRGMVPLYVIVLGIILIIVMISVAQLAREQGEKTIIGQVNDYIAKFREEWSAPSDVVVSYQVSLPPDKARAMELLFTHIIDCKKQYDQFGRTRCAELYTQNMGAVTITYADFETDAARRRLSEGGVSRFDMQTPLGRVTRQPAGVICYATGSRGRTSIGDWLVAAFTFNKVIISSDYGLCG